MYGYVVVGELVVICVDIGVDCEDEFYVVGGCVGVCVCWCGCMMECWVGLM